MVAEIFSNTASTTVSSGGTTAPSAGTTESWTVSSSTGFPAANNAANPPTQFRIVDPAANSEVILVTNVSGTTWSVTRGAESTTPVAHSAGFKVMHVVTSGALGTFLQNSKNLSDVSTPSTARANIGSVQIVNAKTDFGAVGDDSTDDTTALQNFFTAIGQGGSKAGWLGYLPAGTYKVTDTIVGASVTRCIGAGMYMSVIKQYTTNKDVLSFPGTSGANMLGVQLSDFSLQGPGKASGSTGVGLNLNYWLDTCHLKRMIIQQNGSHGIKLQNSYLISFEHIWHYNNGGDGLNAATSINSVKWDNCEFYGNSLNGANISGTAGATFVGCDFETNGQHGLKLDNCYSMTISGNDLENNGTSSSGTTYAGIYVDHTQGYAGPVIVGNNFTGTGGTTANGIELTANVTGAVIDGNSFNNFALQDILIDTSASGVVIGSGNKHAAGSEVLVTDNGTATNFIGQTDAAWTLQDSGWKFWTIQDWPMAAGMSTGSTSANMANYTAGVIWGHRFVLRQPRKISNLHFYWLQPTGGTPANCYAGIINSSGTLVGKTADLTSTTTGMIQPALTGGPFTLQPGSYYAVFVIGTQGSAGTFGGIAWQALTMISGVGVGQSYGGLTAANYRCAKIGNLTGQTGLTGPYTLANNVVSAMPFAMSGY